MASIEVLALLVRLGEGWLTVTDWLSVGRLRASVVEVAFQDNWLVLV